MWKSFLNMWIWWIFYIQSLNIMMIAKIVSTANTFWKKEKLDKVRSPFPALFPGSLPIGRHVVSSPPATNLRHIPLSFPVLHCNEHAPRGLWCVFDCFTWYWFINAFVSAIFERWRDYCPIHPLQQIQICTRPIHLMTFPKPAFWNLTGKEQLSDMEIKRTVF